MQVVKVCHRTDMYDPGIIAITGVSDYWAKKGFSVWRCRLLRRVVTSRNIVPVWLQFQRSPQSKNKRCKQCNEPITKYTGKYMYRTPGAWGAVEPWLVSRFYFWLVVTVVWDFVGQSPSSNAKSRSSRDFIPSFRPLRERPSCLRHSRSRLMASLWTKAFIISLELSSGG